MRSLLNPAVAALPFDRLFGEPTGGGAIGDFGEVTGLATGFAETGCCGGAGFGVGLALLAGA